MATQALRREEGLGLVVAIAAHAALLAALILRPHTAPVVVPPQRIEVTISDDVGLTSASPNPHAQAAPDVAPELGEAQPPPPPMAPVPPVPQARVPEPPRAYTPPAPAPRPQPRPAPAARTPARPQPRSEPKPAPRAEKRSSASPLDAIIGKSRTSTPSRSESRSSSASTTKSKSPPATKKSGGSRIGANFLDGVKGASDASGADAPAQVTGAVRSALAGAVSRQLKPNWQSPSGVDVDKLATTVEWDLNPDGSLAGAPRVVRQTGVNDSNRPQAKIHEEQAIRAVRLSAPFNLPSQYYSAWKRLRFTFDWKLSQ